MTEASPVVEIQDDFYRDNFGKILFILVSIFVAIFLVAAVAVYLYLDKPKPITFTVNPEWRILPAIPLEQPYLNEPDMLQWVSDAVRKMFALDFYHYNDQLKQSTRYFTPDGWKIFLNQLNIYANYNNVQMNKIFITAIPDSAPFILQQGVLTGRYAWWVQVPVDINYISYNHFSTRTLTLQLLVVRVSTLNNLNGVGIDNVIVANGATTGQNQQTGNR